MNINETFYCSKCMQILEEEGICSFCGYDADRESDRHVLEEGSLLNNGRYQLGAVLGAGGFGITYAAWDFVLGQAVAIKEFFPETICRRDVYQEDTVMVSEENLQVYQLGLLRFNREARILATLQNVKSVVTVLDWFEDNETAYIVMEFVKGRTLEQYVKDEKIEASELFELIRDLVDSLVVIHEIGVLHRDISPSNILVQDDGTVKLIDFGAAVIEERRLQGKDKTVVFNRRFAPIEQYDEEGRQGPWTDVYALSSTLYYLITGEFPQEAMTRKGNDSLKTLNSGKTSLKRWQEKAIMNGMIVSPEKRIQSMDIFRSELYHLPMPEEVKKRRTFVRKVISIATVLVVAMGILILNASVGFPGRNGVFYGFRLDGIHVMGYRGQAKNIMIPESYLGIKVTEVEENVFANNVVLRTVSLPKTIQKIASNAFKGNDESLTVWCEDGSKAQEELFEAGINTAAISDYHVEENESGMTIVEYQGEKSPFQSAETFIFPEYIDEKPVTVIKLASEGVMFEETYERIILPKQLTEIGAKTFFSINSSRIELPNTLEKIGESAFAQSFIKIAEFPDSVKEVGDSTFASNVLLTSVRLSNGMYKIPSGMFEGCTSLEDVILPKELKSIGLMSFARCESLQSLQLPESVEEIGAYAFSECIRLKLIYIPENVQNIEKTAFDGCTKELVIAGRSGSKAEEYAIKYGFTFLAKDQWDVSAYWVSENDGLMIAEGAEAEEITHMPSMYSGTTNQFITRLNDARNLKSSIVYLPKYLETIWASSFAENEYLTEIYTYDELESIGSMAFWNCKKFEKAELSAGLLEIGDYCFAKNEKLTEIELPETVENLGAYAFWKCSNLNKINIPSSLTILSDGCMAETAIESINIPGNIVKCRTAFYGCSSLKTVTIEDGVHNLWGTFAECRNLETVVIPASTEQISRSTFRGCISLKDIWIYSKNVNLDFIWPAVRYVSDIKLIDGERQMTYEKLETNYEDTPLLFADCPEVTIHGYRGSSAQVYAMEHGLKFELIE